MEILRDVYLQRLVSKMHNGLIKVVTGIRRCGKSYLLCNIFKRYLISQGVSQDHIVEMAFDDWENLRYRNADEFYNFAKSRIIDDGMYYFLLDEVQMLQDFESVLNGLLRRKNVDIYVTGSNAKFLSRDVITEFRGRGDEVHMQPLSFSEFMSCYQGDRLSGWNEYVLYGGLPPVVLTKEPEYKIEMLNSLFSETYITDIVGRNKIRNVGEMEDLLNILASNIGTLTSPTKLQATFKSVKKSKITVTTITKYLNYLSESYLIEYAKRYDIKGKAYIETPLKYYLTDLGLRNARINFRQIEMPHSMENVIYNELRNRGLNVDVGTVVISEKNQSGSVTRKQLEVDFVANRASKRYYIQSAYAIPNEVKKNQEIRPLKAIDDSFKKIVITSDAPAPFYTDDGILTMSIFDFLLDKNSLDF
ncbi:MAG: ATP-binding protein [Oscillospiraceae bacterium]|nr:ATP-binding protein [Oscillospiraceae bacterium]